MVGKSMRVLVSGANGFLLRNTLPDYDWEIINYKYGEEYSDIDLILHFASPSDSYGFEDEARLINANIDLTIKLCEEALANDCKLIYASSMAVENPLDLYGALKFVAEKYIETNLNDYCIMRIPRVYGKNRTKGLMRKINERNIDDWDKIVEYIDIKDFKIWFNDILNKNMVQYYTGKTQINRIKEIKDLYCES